MRAEGVVGARRNLRRVAPKRPAVRGHALTMMRFDAAARWLPGAASQGQEEQAVSAPAIQRPKGTRGLKGAAARADKRRVESFMGRGRR
jgi:hypothetical protein